MSSKTALALTSKKYSLFQQETPIIPPWQKKRKRKGMSQNTRAQNSGQKGNLRRNNPPQHNIRPLPPQEADQEGDELPLVARRRTMRHQPRRETRTRRLKQRIGTLTKLVNMLVTALGQNADNATPAIPPGRKVYLLQRAGTSRQARPKQTLKRDEGVLGIHVATLANQGTKMEEMRQKYMCPNTPETRCLIDLNE